MGAFYIVNAIYESEQPPSNFFERWRLFQFKSLLQDYAFEHGYIVAAISEVERCFAARKVYRA